MVTDFDDLPVIDAHQHFWDLSLGKHPWLRDEPPPPFRYGDARLLRRDYLPSDYRADVRGHRVVGTVYVETEWDPADPIGETHWVEKLAAKEGLPSAVVAQAWLDRDDVGDVLARQAACPLVRGIRHKPGLFRGKFCRKFVAGSAIFILRVIVIKLLLEEHLDDRQGLFPQNPDGKFTP